MSVDRERAQSIFQAVSALPPSERAAMLERECGGDIELRRQIEMLLDGHRDLSESHAVDLGRTGVYVPSVAAGQVFAGRYKLREKLGEGGMGTVFVADQSEPVTRRVALKIIKGGADSAQLLARFEQERQALALMDHPNIAKVFDAGVDEAGRPYFAMELVKGLSLSKYCDDAKLSLRERLELFVPICQAVQHAHQKGIIHRDLKPSNILVGLYDGRPAPKVIDFGVAKATGPRLTDQSIYTEIGSLIGTLEYMSPEQAELNNLDIDTRSDIYSLGVILYELLTGAAPFSRKDFGKAGLAEMLRIIKESEPPKPSTKLSKSGALPSIAAARHTEPHKLTALLRGELDWIVMKALEKERSRRYETANGFALDVQRYLAGEAVQAVPASQWYRMQKFVNRNRQKVIAAGLGFIALVAFVGGSIAIWHSGKLNLAWQAEAMARQTAEEEREVAKSQRNLAERARLAEQSARKTAEEQKSAAEKARGETARALKLAEQYAYFHKIGLADRSFRDGDVQRSDQLLEECPQLDRKWEWALFKKRNHAELRTFQGDDGSISQIALSADGRTLASSSHSGKVRLWNVNDGQSFKLFERANSAFSDLVLEPNGQWVAASSLNGQLTVWDTLDGKIKKRHQLPGVSRGSVSNLATDSEGRLLAMSAALRVEILDMATGKIQVINTDHKNIIRELSLSPDGRSIATASWDGSIKVWDTASGNNKLTIRDGTSLMALAYSHDGRFIASSGMDFRIKVWNAETADPIANFSGHSFTTRALNFTPDGRHLASSSSDGMVKVWDWVRGEEVSTLCGHQGPVYGVVCSRDGRFTVSCGDDGSVKQWSIPTDNEGLPAEGKAGNIFFNRFAFAPDSTWVARIGDSGRLHLIDAQSGGTLRHSSYEFPLPDIHPNMGLAVHPQGKSIAVGDRTGKIHLVSADTCEVIWTKTEHRGVANALCWSPDGRRLLSGSLLTGEVFIWDAEQEQCLHKLGSLPVVELLFHSDNRRCVAVCEQKICLIDIEAGRVIKTISGGLTALHHGASLNADGSRLAVADAEGTITIWDFETLRKVKRLRGHSGAARSVSFSPDGKRIASTGSDRRIKIWDAESGYELCTLGGLINQGSHVAFAPDGQKFAASDDAQTLRIWSAQPPATEIEAIKIADARNFAWRQTQLNLALNSRDWGAVDWFAKGLIEARSPRPPLDIRLARWMTTAKEPGSDLKAAFADFNRIMKVIEQLIDAYPGAVELQVELAGGWRTLGLQFESQQSAADVRSQFRKAIQIWDRLVVEYPSRSPYRVELGGDCCNLANHIRDGEKPDDCLEWYGKGIDALMPVHEKDPTAITPSYYLRNGHWGRADALVKLKRPVDAIADYVAAIELQAPLVDGVLHRRDSVPVIFRYAVALLQAGKIDEAEKQFEQATKIREQLAKTASGQGEDARLLAWIYFDRAYEYQAAGKLEPAQAWYHRAAVEFAKIAEKQPSNEIDSKRRWAHQNRAAILSSLMKYDDAFAEWKLAISAAPESERPIVRLLYAQARVRADISLDEAIQIAEEVSTAPGAPAEVLYQSACVYSLASVKASDKQRAYTDRAMELLNAAVKAGWKNSDQMKNDSDLEPLRSHEDFKKLLAELEKQEN